MSSVGSLAHTSVKAMDDGTKAFTLAYVDFKSAFNTIPFLRTLDISGSLET